MSFQVKYIYDLVDKISPQLQRIKANVSGMSARVTAATASSSSSFLNLQAKVEAASIKIGASVQKIGHDIGNLGLKARTLGKDLFLKTTLPLGLLGAKFIKTASDYNESLNKVDVAFGDAAVSVKDFANTAGKNFGIDRGSALDMAAMFGDMSTSMGLSQTQAAGLSTSLVGLAGDLASFKNIGVDQAQTALAGIFTGETESLKRLGVVMTETNVQQFALTQGIRKKISEMRQDEKVMLRYSYIMAMTKNSQGDFARTQEGFANQMRILGSRFKDLSITLGTILIPYATKLVNVAISLLEKFNSLSTGTQKWILIVAGIVAVAAPVLIIFGAMASGISALVAGFALITPQVVLFSAAFVSMGLVVKQAYGWLTNFDDKLSSLLNNLKFLKDNFGSVWDEIRGMFGADLSSETQVKMNQDLINKVNAGKAIRDQSLINNPSSINQKSSLDASGTVRVEVGGNAPSGTRASFIPARNSIYDQGTMGAYAQ